MTKIKIKLNSDLCKKCGICADNCPVDVYSYNELEGPEIEKEAECIACDKCIIMCPDFAIEIFEEEEE